MSEPVRDEPPVVSTTALSLAAALLAITGLVGLGFGVLELVASGANRAVLGSGIGFVLVGYAVLLFATARGVRRARRWSRAPALATQLIQVPVAFSLGGGTIWWVTPLLLVVSVTVIVCLLLPSSTALFVREFDSDTDR